MKNTSLDTSACSGACGTSPSTSIKRVLKPNRLIAAAAGGIFFAAGVVFSPGGFLELGLFAAAYLIFGGPVLLRAAGNIARGRVFDENFLMALATLGAFAIGEYPEGVAVMVFYQVGELLQESAVDRSRRSIERLMDIRPDYAHLRKDGQTRRVPPEEVPTGALINVRPGERVPLDGRVVEGVSTLDLAALTGESLPVEARVGAEILSGSVNKTGLLVVEVTRPYSESTVNRILKLVENASARKAKTEKFITRFAAYYTPAVVSAALLLALIPPLILPGQLFSTWAYRALVFLVISCPCALVISIPLGFFGGIGGASKKGILVKGSNYLEALSRVKTVVFDKTGTLTSGTFSVQSFFPANGFSEDDLRRFGAAAAFHSSHPVAVSVGQTAGNGVVESDLDGFEELPGRGVRVRYSGKTILMGSGSLIRESGVPLTGDGGGGESGDTQVHLAVDDLYAGSITVSDEVREDSAEAVKRLRALGVENLIMLTGDRRQVAEAVGSKLGLDAVHYELLPEQKVAFLEKLEQDNTNGRKIAFVGDGINDAPALARAEIGVAMGGVASDAAIEAADVVLMTSQPSKLADAIAVARKTRVIVIQNIFLALGVKAAVMALGLFGLASMWEAVFADVGVALLAVLNSMRAFR